MRIQGMYSADADRSASTEGTCLEWTGTKSTSLSEMRELMSK